MRSLAFIFILVLIVVAIGYFRGWFTVSTTHGAGKGGVTLAVDNDKVVDDTNAAAARVGEMATQAVEGVKSLGSNSGTSEVEGRVTIVDLTTRDLTVTGSSETITVHVQSGVPIMSDGASVGFEQLQPAKRVKLFFQHVGDDRTVTRIEILR